MKAIVYDRYGPPGVLQIRDMPMPEPGDDEIRVRIHAAEATKADCELRSFRFAVNWFWLPLRIAIGILRPRRKILGGYFAGVVESVGEKASKFVPGAEVFGCANLRFGAYGEFACYPEDYTIVEKPRNLSFEEAAAVPLGGLNALHFLRRARIRAGDRVLINGAGGSIGSFGVQIAKAMGAEVTAVDSAAKSDMLRRIGADRVIDYASEDFARNGQRYDVIFDMVARSNYSKCIGALNPGGRYLKGNPRLLDMLRCVLTTRFTDKTADFAFAGETGEELLALKEMIEAGRITPAIDEIYPPEEAARAHDRVETERRLGIVVISWRTASTTAKSGVA